MKKIMDVSAPGHCDVFNVRELTCLQAIYDLLGEEKKGANSPEIKVDQIFSKMDVNSDQKLSKDEFVTGCLQDDYLRKLLAPSAS